MWGGWGTVSTYMYYFFCFSTEACCGYSLKCLSEALLMSTHNMFSCRNKKNISILWFEKKKKNALSGAVIFHCVYSLLATSWGSFNPFMLSGLSTFSGAVNGPQVKTLISLCFFAIWCLCWPPCGFSWTQDFILWAVKMIRLHRCLKVHFLMLGSFWKLLYPVTLNRRSQGYKTFFHAQLSWAWNLSC